MVGLLGSLRRSKIGVVISTESAFNESERSISSDSMFDSVAYYLVKPRLSESEAEADESTNNKARKGVL